MMKKLLILFVLSQILISCNGYKANAYNPEGFNKFVDNVQSLARQQGVSEKTLQSAFHGVKFDYKMVVLDAKQPERKKEAGFENYKAKIVSQARINTAQAMLDQNRLILTDIENKFGVQKEILVSLWAVESSFGTIMGKNDIITSLTSLAYEGRRREFFQAELINSLKILDQGHVTRDNFKGSWAGAFGQVQFMPSTFLKYAYDYDNDGKKDIWYNNGDALSSAANYLSSIGWKRNEPWGKKAVLPNGFNSKYIGLDISLPYSKWKALGVKYADGTELPTSGETVSIVGVDYQYGKRNEIYIVTDNYSKIMNWNKSTYFATSIGLIANSIK